MELDSYIRVFGLNPREVDLRQSSADETHATELDYFADCIADGRKPEAITLDDACGGLLAIDAILASLRTGRIERA